MRRYQIMGFGQASLLLSQMLSLLDAGDSLSLSPSDIVISCLIKETGSILFLLFWTKAFVPHTMWKIRVQSCGAIDICVARTQPSAYRVVVSCAFARSVPYEVVLAVVSKLKSAGIFSIHTYSFRTIVICASVSHLPCGILGAGKYRWMVCIWQLCCSNR
jgi:hypothetical protein